MSTITSNAAPCLWDFQETEVLELREGIKLGLLDQLLVSPTGSGKSELTSHMAASAVAKGKRPLFIVNRRGLAKDISRRWHKRGIKHGVIMANHGDRRPWELAQIASIDTLHRREVMPAADLIFCDEAHFCVSAIWKKVLDHYKGVPKIFMTATPIRSDGRGLGEIATRIVLGPSTAELTKRGFLAPVTIYGPPVDLTGVKARKGTNGGIEYNQKQLVAKLEKSRIVGDVVDHWMKRGKGMPTILFSVSIKESLKFVAKFAERGIRVVHVDAKTKDHIREQAWRQLASGEIEVVCSVGLISYGWDVPEVRCGIDAAPTLQVGKHLQKIGRIMRKHHSKPFAIWLDHAGNCDKHGYPETPREWTLDGLRKRNPGEKDNAPPVRKCGACWRDYDPREYQRCPDCGVAPEPRDIAPPEEVGELVEVSAEQRAGYVIKKLSSNPKIAALQKEAQAKGYKPGWVFHRRQQLEAEALMAARP